jgi:hypothetical protein
LKVHKKTICGMLLFAGKPFPFSWTMGRCETVGMRSEPEKRVSTQGPLVNRKTASPCD